MSEPITLPDVLKAAPTAASPSNLSMICVDSSGNLSKYKGLLPQPTSPICHNADEAVPGFMRTLSSTTNLPGNGLGGFIFTMQYDEQAKVQFFTQYTQGDPTVWTRRRVNSAWDPWKKFMYVA